MYVLFGPVKPKLEVNPSGQENQSKTELSNFPGRELNVINITEQYFILEKNQRPVTLNITGLIQILWLK